ncbi:MAG: DUF2608 domain-containing protein [Candidatus Babeliales bacterium]
MFILLLLCLFVVTLDAKIVEHQYMQEIEAYVTHSDETLVIFDIDNTLIEPDNWIGGPIWFDHIIRTKMKDEGLTYRQAEAAAVQLLAKVITQVNFVPVEQNTVLFIELCKKSGTRVIALTARSTMLADHTHETLLNVGMCFSDHTFITPAVRIHEKYHHHHGIIFCSGMCKGVALVHALKEHCYNPKRIICIDDCLRHLIAIEKQLAQEFPDIEFIGIRYSHLDYKKALFDPISAEKELQKLLATS